MTIAIVTDSTASVPPELAQQYNIRVIPLKVLFGQESYRDGIDIMPAEFYRRVEENKELPTTSQPSAGEFSALYAELAQEHDGIVSVHISSQLSGTVGAAQTAAKQASLPVRVVDSLSTAMGLGFAAVEAAKAAQIGGSLDEAARRAEVISQRMHVHLLPRTLNYLKWGGRIGGAASLVATILNIHPVLYVKDGRAEVLEKVRTHKRALHRMVESIVERLEPGDGTVHVAIHHVNNRQDADRVAEIVKIRLNPEKLIFNDLSLAVGVHVGPGTVGVIAYREP